METRRDSIGTFGFHPRRFLFTGSGGQVHILYMDESGVEELGAGSSHFVLLGIAIPSEE